MAVHRRQLPILDPCDGFEPAAGAQGLGGFCERCRKEVVDVSAMHEAELRRFLARRVGTEVCVAYRVGDRGWLQLQPTPRLHRLALTAAVALLAACAGHVTELEIPGPHCVDAEGYEVTCTDPTATEMVTVPDGMGPVASREPSPEGGCPIPPPRTTPVPANDPREEHPLVEGIGLPPPMPERAEPADPYDAPGTDAKVRVDFSIDPTESVLRGAVVVVGGLTVERDFIPTAQLWAEAKERRQQRREQRRHGRRQRQLARAQR